MGVVLLWMRKLEAAEEGQYIVACEDLGVNYPSFKC